MDDDNPVAGKLLSVGGSVRPLARALRRRARASLRHRLGFAGACIALALIVGLGSYAFEAGGDSPRRASADASPGGPPAGADDGSMPSEASPRAIEAAGPPRSTSVVGAIQSLLGIDGAEDEGTPSTAPAPGLTIAPSTAGGTRTTRALAATLPARVVEPFRSTFTVEREALPVATPKLGSGDRILATVSFYYCLDSIGLNPRGDGGGFCGRMRDGSVVYSGAAACDFAYLGQRFRIDGDPTGRVYTCADTGSAVHGLHRDIWFDDSDSGWRWVLSVGTRATIEIID